MEGTVAITDYGWYEFLLTQGTLDEVNFWTPSAHWPFRAAPGSPFFFKLKARHEHAVCGFAHFARFSRLPDWLAWVWFMIKVLAILFFYVWMRWTLPRYRYDQLMQFGWKVLLPIAVVNLLVTAAGVLYFGA